MFHQVSSSSQTESSADACCSQSPSCSGSMQAEKANGVSAIGIFIEALQNDIRTLEVKVNREDSLTVASVAYRVKSHAQALGIDVIERSANQIEVCARRNQIAQMSAEIDLMRHQVDLFVRSSS